MNRPVNFVDKYREKNKRFTDSLWLLSSFFLLTVFSVQSSVAQVPTVDDFQRTIVADGLDLPMEFEIAKDGRVFVVGKCGALYAWNLDGGVATQTATVANVRCEFEDGLLSVALDPNFTTNGYIYFQYTAPGSLTRVSRYTVNANNTLDMTSEKILLEWRTGDEAHGHMGGSMQFDNDGNLIITTGDNKAAGGYFQPAAQQTSGNTNDLRGKILRIKPTAAGGYTIPAGNLFPADATHRPEIYAMGFRNPFRLNIDPLTGYLYVGDIGPDSSADSAEGPGGLDELNEIREAGNFGWPYIIGYNQPYAGFNPNNIVNNYNLNTGATNLPSSKSALWTIRHQATMAGPVYRFNENLDSEYKLPAYYNGKLIFWDFNSSKFFTIDLTANNNPPIAEDFPLNTGGFQGAIDAEFDPRTHQFYVLQWGSGCCDKEPYGNGVLYRFDYIGGRDSGPNMAQGATATASSPAVGGNLPAYAVDGDPTTRWESPSADPQVLNIELAQPTIIATIFIKWEAAYSSKYTIEASVDGVTWDLLVTEDNGAGKTTPHIINSTKAYRYLRLTGTARGTNYGHSIYEFEVYAGEAPEPEVPLTEFAYLNMPRTLDANFTDVPQLLSQTGAFSNTANLTPSANLLPFSPNSPLWSDRAEKFRWVSLPADTKVQWSAQGDWKFPQGTVAVKHFELPVDVNNPALTKRLETRLIVTKADGKIYGVTYKWRADNSDADLLMAGAQEDISVRQANGSNATQTWFYPSPADCLSCHNAESSQILGLSTRQLNGNYTYPGGTTQNQLVHWNNRGLFTPALNNALVNTYDKLAALSDSNASLEKRVKSYLDTNCGHCHGTGNGGSQWDARFNTALGQMKVVNATTTGIRNYEADYGIANAKVVEAGAPQQSILYLRDKTIDPNDRMPPIGRALEHTEYIQVLDQWITSLGAPSVAPPRPAKLTPVEATASSFQGGNTAPAAIDGNAASRWESEPQVDPQYLQLDMGKRIYFTEVRLNWEAAYARAYTIEVSDNGDDWTVVYSTTNSRGGLETIPLNGEQGQYIRMHGTERATGYGYSLFEFEAYGVEADADVALINIVTPATNAVIDQSARVSLRVNITDPNWLTNYGFTYSLDDGPATVATSDVIDLGLLPTGQHSLRVTLIDNSGNEVGVPRNSKFRVSCGESCPSVLVFSKTAGFRHDSIPDGIAMVQQIAQDNGYTVTASEDSSLFTTANLANYSTIVFMNTTGDVFTDAQKATFKSYIENGGGYVGTHAAADTEHGWDWYTDTVLGGGEFIHHGDGIPRATVVIEDITHALVNHIGAQWILNDEWYFWKSNPRESEHVEVLGNLDRSSYTSNYPVDDHPVIYTNTVGEGRIFYTAIGHVKENFADPKMVEMIRKAIEWTSNIEPVAPPPASSSSSSVMSSSVASSSRSSSSRSASSVANVSSSSSALASSSRSAPSASSASSVGAISSASSTGVASSTSAGVSSVPVVNSSSSSARSSMSSTASSISSTPGNTGGGTSSSPAGSGGGSVAWHELLLLCLFAIGLMLIRRHYRTTVINNE